MRVRAADCCSGRGARQIRILPAPTKNADAGPWSDDESDGEREEHRSAGADRYGPHVRSHKTADESHWQHRRDNGKGGEDCRVANFAHRLDSNGSPVSSFVIRQVKVADDILDNDNRVIHENAD